MGFFKNFVRSIPGVGDFFSLDDKQKADAAYRKALEELGAKFYGDDFVAPEYDTGYYSQAADAYADPAAIAAQRAALARMQEVMNEGGLTAADRAAMYEGLRAVDQSNRGNREAILSAQRRRGGFGAGSDLTAQLMGAQHGAQNAASVGNQAVMNAQARMLQATGAVGSMGSNMREQSFGEAFQRGSAADDIHRFNEALKGQGFQDQLALREAKYNAGLAPYGAKVGHVAGDNKILAGNRGFAVEVGEDILTGGKSRAARQKNGGGSGYGSGWG